MKIIVSSGAAEEIIKDAQRNELRSHKLSLETWEDKKKFKDFAKALRGSDEIRGNERVIEEMRRIINTRDFYDSLVSVKRTRKGLIILNKEFIVHPEKYMQMDASTRDQILKYTSQLARGAITEDKFAQLIEKIAKENRIMFESQRRQTVFLLKKALDVVDLKSFKIGEKTPFAHLRPFEIDSISRVMTDSFSRVSATENYDTAIIGIALVFAKQHGCNNSLDFCSYLGYAVHYMSKTKQSKEPSTDYKALQCMNEQFMAHRRRIAHLNSQARIPFRNTIAATYHYVKHREWGSRNMQQLSPQEYFTIAKDVLKMKVDPKNIMFTQEGGRSITYTNPVNGAKAISFQTITKSKEKQEVLCTLYFDKVHTSK